MRDTLIVGGGPAGALCGERLATAGLRVTIFDEHLAWEKPCGGGLTHKAIAAYPFLLDGPHPKKIVRRVEMISSGGHRTAFGLDRPIVIYSRAILNGLLLDRATAAGCTVVRARVTRLDTGGRRARVRTAQGTHEGDFAVIAAGARNALLAGSSPLEPEDLEITVGYFLPLPSDVLKVKFLPQFEGYLWSFPRHDHLSVGICGKMSQNSSAGLKAHLAEFLRDEHIDCAGGRFYSHVLPSPRAATLRSRRVAGRNWALAGDAAAWVDPLTGEGLYYAMRSGDLLAQSLLAGKPLEYPQRVRAEFAADLEIGARIARRFYRGSFLCGAVPARMIQFAHRSKTFRVLMRDLFSGAQGYSDLKRRLWAQLGTTLGEILASSVIPAPAARTGEPAS
ncbi:MAG: FAD-dependent oxidoreductase [Candidatus Acidiferrales bacterium]